MTARQRGRRARGVVVLAAARGTFAVVPFAGVFAADSFAVVVFAVGRFALAVAFDVVGVAASTSRTSASTARTVPWFRAVPCFANGSFSVLVPIPAG